MTNTRITLELLTYLDACQPERGLFAALFPDGVEVTRELCVQHAERFSWDWAAARLLSELGYARYCDALGMAGREYAAEHHAADTEYYDALDKIDEAYRSMATSGQAVNDESDKSRVAAREAYKLRLEPVHVKYNLARAAAFADCYLADENRTVWIDYASSS